MEYSIATHSFIKVSLLKAYITIYNYEVIFLSETYDSSSIPPDDNNLEVLGYDLTGQTTRPTANEEVSVSVIEIHYH